MWTWRRGLERCHHLLRQRHQRPQRLAECGGPQSGNYARQKGLPEAIIARLEHIAEAAAKLVHHAPDAIWDFAKAAGMTDELTAREQEREDEHRAAVEGPNGLFQILRRKHEE